MPLTTKQGSGEKRKRAWTRGGEGERILLSLLCGYCLPINFSEDVSLMASFVKSLGSYSLIRAYGDVRPAKVCFSGFCLKQGIDFIIFLC